ncbi:hypothetical protein, partial [Chryseobacterium sp. EO14]|uniref:hypothetical protein n=1 Tax=Chryseobacterium sp. EO14 TaxID=2950551 RepID=UPI00210EC59F
VSANLFEFLGLNDQLSSILPVLGNGGGSSATDPTPKNTGPNLIQRIGNFFSNLFGGKKSTASGHNVKATVVDIAFIPEGVAEGSISASLRGAGTGLFSTAGLTAGAIFVPTMIGEPEFNWTRQFDGSTDVPITTTTGEPEQMITLYRGVSSKAKGSMYFEAMQGIAIPGGFRQVSAAEGPHRDMELHAGGGNLSIWTSWTSDVNVARDFATGNAFYINGVPGIIMSKTFTTGQAVPNPFTLGESEWLVPGVVYGAKVQYVLPRSK